MDIKKELEKTLERIDNRYNGFGYTVESNAILLNARANVLIALQKYEVQEKPAYMGKPPLKPKPSPLREGY